MATKVKSTNAKVKRQRPSSTAPRVGRGTRHQGLSAMQQRAFSATVGQAVTMLTKTVLADLNKIGGATVAWSEEDLAVLRVILPHYYKAAGVSDALYQEVWDGLGLNGGQGNGGTGTSLPVP